MAKLIESEDDEVSEVESFILGQGDSDEEPVLDTSKLLLSVEGSQDSPNFEMEAGARAVLEAAGIHLGERHEVNPESRARLEKLLEAAGLSNQPIDPDVLKRITSSVSYALDEAAATLTRMRSGQSHTSSSSSSCSFKTKQNQALDAVAAAVVDGSSLIDACNEGDLEAVRRLLDEGRNVNEMTEEGESLLSLACSSGYYELAQLLLATRANVEDRGLKDTTPLMEASSAGHVEIVKLLISHGANVNAQTNQSNTPLIYACAGGHVDVVKVLIEAGANLEDLNENGHTPLMEAASAGHVDVAKKLVEAGASINTHSNDYKESALTLACYKGHLEMVRFLLEAGADQEHKTEEMHTALMEASMDGHVEVARLLLDSGAQVNMPADSFESPLTLASCGGHVELAMLLLQRGANIEEVNDEGYTPLMEAAREGHEEMVGLLLSQGADINAQTEETQETALTLACCSGYLEVADFLIKAGADIEAGANTPLMEAAQEGHIELVKHLISLANVNATTASGDTALMYACENGHTEVAGILLDAGAYLEHEAEGGRTPLMKACRAGHLCTVQFLVSRGANINKVTTNNDHTPLSLACAGGHLSVVEFLLTRGADPTHRLKDNSTMLIEASRGGHTNVVQFLIDYPHNLSHPDLNECEISDDVSSTRKCSSSGQKGRCSSKSSKCESELVKGRSGSNSKLERSLSDSSASHILNSVNSVNLSNNSPDNPPLASTDAFMETERLEKCINNMMKRTELLNPSREEQILEKQKILEELQRVEKELQEKAQAQVFLTHHAQQQQRLIQTLCYQASLSGQGNAASNIGVGSGTSEIGTQEDGQASVGSSQINNLTNVSSQAMWLLDMSALKQLKGNESLNFQLPPMSNSNGASFLLPSSKGGGGTIVEGEKINEPNGIENVENTGISSGVKCSKVKNTAKVKNTLNKSTCTSVQCDNGDEDNESVFLQDLASNLSDLSQAKPETLQFLKQTSSGGSFPFLFPPLLDLNSLNTWPTPSTQQQQQLQQQPNQQQTQSTQTLISSLPHLLEGNFRKSLVNESPLSSSTSTQTSEGKSKKKSCSVINSNMNSSISNTLPSLLPSLSNQEFQILKSHLAAAAMAAESNDASVQTGSPIGAPAFPVTLSLSTNATNVTSYDEGFSKSPDETATDFNVVHPSSRAVHPPLDGLSFSPTNTMFNPLSPIGFPSIPLASNSGINNKNYTADLPVQLSEQFGELSERTDSPSDQVIGSKVPSPHIWYPPLDLDSQTDSNHDTALTLACAGGHEELVQLLILRGASVEHRDKKGFTPLMLAATAGHARICEIILMHDSDIEAQSERTKDTALSLACSSGRYEVVELLLNKGANKEHRNVSDYTPLSLAASGGYVNIIKLLLSHGAEINSRTGSKLGISPLMLASMNGHVLTVKLLLDMGSDINAQIETNKNTALTLACFQGRCEVVSLLLDRKANVEHRAKTGLTPLMEAASGGYVEVGRILLDKGADVNAPPVPSSRDTALTIAADKGHYKFVELLLSRGAQVDVKNKKGSSSLWLACNGGHLDVVQLLVNAKTDIDSQDNRKVSCLMAAFRKGHIKVVKWMVKHVTQFPSDQEMTRYLALLNDKELIKKCGSCMEIIRLAKEKQAAEAYKNAKILLEEIDMEKSREETRKLAAARRREKKRAKKKEKQEQLKAAKAAQEKKRKPKKGDESDFEFEDESDDSGDEEIVEEIKDDKALKENEKNKLNCVISKKNKVKLKEENETNEAKEEKHDKSGISQSDNSKKEDNVFIELSNDASKENVSSPEKASNDKNQGMFLAKNCNSSVPLTVNSSLNSVSPISNFIAASQTGQAKKQVKREEGWKEVVRKSKKVSVPANAISRVIGRGGCNINAVREISGAHIEVDKQKGQGDRQIIIKGSADATRHAQSLISGLVNEPDKDLTAIVNQLGLSRPSSVNGEEHRPIKSMSSACIPKGSIGGVTKSSSLIFTAPNSTSSGTSFTRSSGVVSVRPSPPSGIMPPFNNNNNASAWGKVRLPVNPTSSSVITNNKGVAKGASTISTISKTTVSYTIAMSSKSKTSVKSSVPSVTVSTGKCISNCEVKSSASPFGNASTSVSSNNSGAPSNSRPTSQPFNTTRTGSKVVTSGNKSPFSAVSSNSNSASESTPEYTPFNNLFSKVAQASVWGSKEGNKPNFASVAASGISSTSCLTISHSEAVDASKAPGYRGHIQATGTCSPNSAFGPIGSGPRSAPCTPPLGSCSRLGMSSSPPPEKDVVSGSIYSSSSSLNTSYQSTVSSSVYASPITSHQIKNSVFNAAPGSNVTRPNTVYPLESGNGMGAPNLSERLPENKGISPCVQSNLNPNAPDFSLRNINFIPNQNGMRIQRSMAFQDMVMPNQLQMQMRAAILAAGASLQMQTLQAQAAQAAQAQAQQQAQFACGSGMQGAPVIGSPDFNPPSAETLRLLQTAITAFPTASGMTNSPGNMQQFGMMQTALSMRQQQLARLQSSGGPMNGPMGAPITGPMSHGVPVGQPLGQSVGASVGAPVCPPVGCVGLSHGIHGNSGSLGSSISHSGTHGANHPGSHQPTHNVTSIGSGSGSPRGLQDDDEERRLPRPIGTERAAKKNPVYGISGGVGAGVEGWSFVGGDVGEDWGSEIGNNYTPNRNYIESGTENEHDFVGYPYFSFDM